MAQSAIDVDRGVTIRQIVKFDGPKFEADVSLGGLTVYMYKDEPGIFLDAHGKRVPDALAAKAGYDIVRLGKLRAKRAAIEAFSARMAEELAVEDGEEVTLAEAGDWKVIALPMDRAKVVDAYTGEAVTAVPMPRGDAIKLLEALAEEQDKSAAIDAEAKAKGKEVKS